MTQCPKCGFQQDGGVECLGCGIIFDRIHRPAETTISEQPLDAIEPSGRSVWERVRSYYRMFRYVSLFAIIVIVIAILCNSTPPEVEVTSHAVQQAEYKVREFQTAIQQGRSEKLEMDQSELNGWLDKNLAFRDPVDSEFSSLPEQPSNGDEVGTVPESDVLDDAAMEKAKSSIRDIQIELFEDTLLIYAVFDSHGIDLSLEIEGRLSVEEGCLRLDPVRGKIGSLPLPSGALQSAVTKLFESPENMEKLRLPAHIRDMKIDGGQLIVTSR